MTLTDAEVEAAARVLESRDRGNVHPGIEGRWEQFADDARAALAAARQASDNAQQPTIADYETLRWRSDPGPRPPNAQHCPTCGKLDNVFCSDAWHRPPDAQVRTDLRKLIEQINARANSLQNKDNYGECVRQLACIDLISRDALKLLPVEPIPPE